MGGGTIICPVSVWGFPPSPPAPPALLDIHIIKMNIVLSDSYARSANHYGMVLFTSDFVLSHMGFLKKKFKNK